MSSTRSKIFGGTAGLTDCANVTNSSLHAVLTDSNGAIVDLYNGGLLPVIQAPRGLTIGPITTTGVAFLDNSFAGAWSIWTMQVSSDVPGVGATAWTIELQLSNDGVDFTTVLTHGTADLNGKLKIQAAPYAWAPYARFNVTALTLGPVGSLSIYASKCVA